jgi:hypothetical protein
MVLEKPQGEISASPEAAPRGEIGAESPANKPEVAAEPSKEAFADTKSVPNPSQPPVQAPVQADDATSQAAPILTTSPSDQKDVPLADQRWVDAVDQVIKDTKGHPYEEEEEAETLQIKYLFKRFGKILKRDKNDKR